MEIEALRSSAGWDNNTGSFLTLSKHLYAYFTARRDGKLIRIMKNLFRKIIGFSLIFPFALMVYIFSPFLGREKAIKICGQPITFIAKSALVLFVPKIKNAAEFDLVPSKIKARFWLWRPLYDYSRSYQDKNVVKLHVSNCPFYEALDKLGIKEMGLFICQGDWEIAKDYSDKWDFERKHQIATGDGFCDHTYKRKVTF